MSKKLASLLIKINADGANAKRVMTELEGRVDRFAKNMQKIGTTLTRNLTLPLTALASAGIALANTQLQAEAKLLTALKGREDIQMRLIAQASELQARSTYGDEEIIAQQAILAAMGLTEAQIRRTIQAATELSAALGMDLSSAVRNLGKTYGGLTGELGETIPALKDLSEEALRNGEAIDYVNEHYQGFAQTAAETGAGPLVQLKNKLGDLGEKIGTVLMPTFSALVDVVSKFVDVLSALSPGVTTSIVAVGALAAASGPLVTAFGALVKYGGTIASTFGTIVYALQSMMVPVMAVVMQFGELLKTFKNIREEAEAFNQKTISNQERRYRTVYDEHYKRGKDRFAGFTDEMLNTQLLAAEKDYQDRYDAIRATKADGVVNVEREASLAAFQAQIDVLRELIALREEEARLAREAAQARAQEAAQLAAARRGNTPIATSGVSFSGVSMRQGELVGKSPLTAAYESWEEWENQADTMAKKAVDIGQAVANAFSDMAVTIGEGLGSLFSGEEFDWGKSLLNILGNLLKTIGKKLITTSGVIEKIRAAINALFANPAAGFIAGIAAVTAGTAMINLANKPVKLAKGGLAYGPTLAVVGDNPGAAADPEVVAPLSKLRNYVGGQALELVGDVEFVLRGDTMRAVLNRENVRLSRLG